MPAVRSIIEKNVDDLVQMDDINEAMIVHNLRKRFRNNEIYVRRHLFIYIENANSHICSNK